MPGTHVWFKQGVTGRLTLKAQKGFGRLVRSYHSEGLDFFCTSLEEGTHSSGSLHYTGDAWDYQPQGRSIETDRTVLGSDFDVVESNSGARHAEYDP